MRWGQRRSLPTRRATTPERQARRDPVANAHAAQGVGQGGGVVVVGAGRAPVPPIEPVRGMPAVPVDHVQAPPPPRVELAMAGRIQAFVHALAGGQDGEQRVVRLLQVPVHEVVGGEHAPADVARVAVLGGDVRDEGADAGRHVPAERLAAGDGRGRRQLPVQVLEPGARIARPPLHVALAGRVAQVEERVVGVPAPPDAVRQAPHRCGGRRARKRP